MNFYRKKYFISSTLDKKIYINNEFNFVEGIKYFFADFKDFHFLKESNFLSSKVNFSAQALKTPVFFLRVPLRVFHLFCINFFMFSFLQMFLGGFIVDCIF